MSEFVIDEKTQTIASCPAGHAPISCQYKVKTDSYYAHFNKGTCSTCPLRHHCGVKFQKKTGLVHISGKTIRRAAYMKKLVNLSTRNRRGCATRSKEFLPY